MKKLAVTLTVLLVATGAIAADPPKLLEWAYPNAPVDPKNEPPATQTFTAEGAPATMKLTMAQINDPNNPPDWFPAEHGPVPRIVSHGLPPEVRACMQCHLVHGQGKPESSAIASLTAKHIIDQTHYFRDGLRNNSRSANMVALAKAITDEELKIAADYYASLPPITKPWIRVVEATHAPESVVVNGGGRFVVKGSKKMVPIPPNQIFEIAESDEVKLRNPRVGFVAYVPKGSVALGKVVASGNMGKMPACQSCHGAGLKGQLDTPGLAGRSPTYLVRQMSDMKIGNRHGAALGLMKNVIAKMTEQDMVNVAAYAATLKQ